MLEVDDIHVRFGEVVALDGMSFSVAAGHMVGFVGPNGAGKTTTMRTIVGLVEQQSGAVCWKGEPVSPEVRRGIGYMPEERGLYLRMKVLEQVTYFGQLTGMSRAAAATAATERLDALGLGDRLDADLQELSHGNQQRVQLAAALVHQPELLILDEPFSGLDPLALTVMTTMLEELASLGVTVLFSSHQLDVVEDLCREVVVVSAGRCVGAGEVDELRAESSIRIAEIGFEADVDWDGPIGRTVADHGRLVRCEVADTMTPSEVLAVANTYGAVRSFRFEPPDLAAVFRGLVQ